jgi:phosphate transport system substrate-binding protein
MATIFLIAAILSLSACGAGFHTDVIVAGSTSVQPYAEVLAEEYVTHYPGRAVDVQGGGSSAGITAAETGVADIGMSSRSLNEKEQHLQAVEIARDGLAIIAHPSNAVYDLTPEQIRGIYSRAVTSWNAVGGVDAKIHLITREEGSGTRSAFESLVMDGLEITPKAIVQDSNGAVRQLVADDKNAVGFISMGLADETVKTIRLAGVEATWENIKNETYSLFRPFLFVTNDHPSDNAGQFIAFAMSEVGRKILADEGLITP